MCALGILDRRQYVDFRRRENGFDQSGSHHLWGEYMPSKGVRGNISPAHPQPFMLQSDHCLFFSVQGSFFFEYWQDKRLQEILEVIVVQLHSYPLVYVVNVESLKSPNEYFVLKTNKVNLHTDAEDDCCNVTETLVL